MKRLTRKEAIKAFCVDCMGGRGNRKYVKECTAPDCALFPYRLGRRVPDPSTTPQRARKTQKTP
jgi:hypothetical protein